VSLALAGDILAAFEQLFGQLQFLTVLRFQFVERHDQVSLPAQSRSDVQHGSDCQRDIFQQRLLLHVERGELRAMRVSCSGTVSRLMRTRAARCPADQPLYPEADVRSDNGAKG
jgi:hypothetical protein